MLTHVDTQLFNQIQVTNGKAMQAILKAAQEDNRISQQIAFQSHLLAQSMKNDSVAMKTVSELVEPSETLRARTDMTTISRLQS